MRRLVEVRVLAACTLFVLAACGGEAGETEEADTTASADTSTQVAATESQGGSAESQPTDAPMLLTAEDIELYRRGREAEIAQVRDQGEQLEQAKSQSDSGTVMAALVDERGRQRAAAASIGIDEQRYFRLLETVDEVLRKWQFAKMSADMTKGVDTTTLTAEQRAQMRSAATPNYDGLPPQNVQLIVPRAPLLDSLRMTPALLALAVAQGRG